MNSLPFTPKLGEGWTLLLDRDGVINEELPGDYVKSPEAFIFQEGVLEAIAGCRDYFDRIVIVTNQRGVGRGVMTLSQLHAVHAHMLVRIAAAGGRIDSIYYCTELDNEHPNRKPQIGMALQAKEQFPEIDFSKSVMVGNTKGDMLFANRIGAKAIFLPTTQTLPDPAIAKVDMELPSLYAFWQLLVTC